MKIRIHANSIRFRLKEHEVKSFEKNKVVKEELRFGTEITDQLQFVLVCSEMAEFALEQNGMIIQLNIPGYVAKEWADTDKVAIEQMVTTSKGEQIKILVEKDFKCLDGSEQDNVGAYPNPKKTC
jgi:hypothetical protein